MVDVFDVDDRNDDQPRVIDSAVEKRQRVIDEEVKDKEALFDKITDIGLLRDLVKAELRSGVRQRLMLEEAKSDISLKCESTKFEKEHYYEKFVQVFSLMSLRAYVEQLEEEFLQGSQSPTCEQMLTDLEAKKVQVECTIVSKRYVMWCWFLLCSKYGPAKTLRRLVEKHREFNETTDFVELICHLYSTAGNNIHRPIAPLKGPEIKRGIEFYGLKSAGMDAMIDTLFKLQEPKISKKSSSKEKAAQIKKKIKIDRSTIRSSGIDSSTETEEYSDDDDDSDNTHSQ